MCNVQHSNEQLLFRLDSDICRTTKWFGVWRVRRVFPAFTRCELLSRCLFPLRLWSNSWTLCLFISFIVKISCFRGIWSFVFRSIVFICCALRRSSAFNIITGWCSTFKGLFKASSKTSSVLSVTSQWRSLRCVTRSLSTSGSCTLRRSPRLNVFLLSNEKH